MQLGIQIVPQRSPYPPVQPRRASLLRRRADRRLGWLGQTPITAAAAADTVFPTSDITKTAGENQAAWNIIEASAAAGQMLDASGNPGYIPGSADCSALSSAPSGAIVGTAIASAVAAKVAPFTGPAAPFVALGAAIVGLFSSILGKHAAAIKDEQSLLCTAVPAANQALQTIQSAVSSGQINAAAGIQALASLQAQFATAVAPILKGHIATSTCNAACVMTAELNAIIAYLTSQWTEMAEQQAATPAASATSTPSVAGAVTGVTSAVSSVAASTGLPSWAIYAAAGVVLFMFLGK